VDHYPLDAAAKSWLCDTDTWAPLANDPDLDRLWNERYAMVVFYYSTNGDGWWTNDKWLLSTSVCDWEFLNDGGFTESPCGNSGSLVTQLSPGESCLSLFPPVAQLQQVCHLTCKRLFFVWIYSLQ
jgi:hypothetical protein